MLSIKIYQRKQCCSRKGLAKKTLSSIESQPKKVVVLVVVIVFVVVIIVGHKNLTLKFGQSWVNKRNILYCFHCFSFVVVVDPETEL